MWFGLLRKGSVLPEKHKDLWDWGNGCINRSTDHTSREVPFFFLTQHSLDHIYNSAQFWESNEIDMTKWAQQRVPRTARAGPLALWGGEAEGRSCSILQQGWLWGHLTASPQGQQGGYRGDGARLFAAVPGGRKMDNGHNLRQETFRLHMESNVFTVKTVQQWDRQLREALQSPSLETQLDIAPAGAGQENSSGPFT